MPNLLSPSMARALAVPVEINLRQLLDEYGLDANANLLLSLATVQSSIDAFGLKLTPGFGMGGLDDPRVLFSQVGTPIEAILKEIAGLETSGVEFKSTFQIDLRRQRNDPGRKLEDYKSEAVIHSALKTIAAFANSSGGTLYLGVEDNGEICGLESDFSLAGAKANFDGWDLYFRNILRRHFYDGEILNHYLQTQCFVIEGRPIVQIKITGRSKLTFLKKGDQCELFVRSGTQTNSIHYSEIEHHFRLTPLY